MPDGDSGQPDGHASPGGRTEPSLAGAAADPARWIAANRYSVAIRDAHPVSPGHTLVLPRRAIATWSDATLEERTALLDLVADVQRRLDAEFAPEGYNVGFNEGRAAGQTAEGLHLHVIPRYSGDTVDPTGGIRQVIPGRANYLDPGGSSIGPRPPKLVTPSGAEFKLELLRALINPVFDRIDLLVSFVMRSGIDLVANHIDEALARGAHVRLLTTDYLAITDTSALGFFLDRADEPGSTLEARIFHDPATSFHPKAYLFRSSRSSESVAFVGSSNLSRSALEVGIEWNVRTDQNADLIGQFDALWQDGRVVPLTRAWLDDYEVARATKSSRRVGASDAGPANEERIADATREAQDPPQPWSVQRDALAALEASRHEGHERGLVVMATGLGKTWLAAFDSTRPEWGRVLFVAHREEILRQTRDVFRQVRPTGTFGWFSGGRHEVHGDVVFAGVQSLHRHLDDFAPDAFDYVVVDEFHHASADTYRRVLAHFRPRFLLGLTATPERADAADLLALCGDNLVYDCGLADGVRRGLLSTFVYRAIPDVADYAHIPWRSGRFSADELTAELATQARADQVIAEWRKRDGDDRRTLGFCCTIAHAEYMAERFRAAGVAAVAVHSGPTSADRMAALERLTTGDLAVVFTVDLFNEGVDVPGVDLVLLLRPTESPVVFFQQLGRGLRKSDGKSHLDVIDLVGNHRSFLLKARLIAELAGLRHPLNREAVDFLKANAGALSEGGAGLPPGCSIVVEPEVINLLDRLAGPVRDADVLMELIRDWVETHDGGRPTALAMSLASGKPLRLKPRGGWFGLLSEAGLLTAAERAVIEPARGLLSWIETSAKPDPLVLVALRVLARRARTQAGLATDELGAAVRWEVVADPGLRAAVGPVFEMPNAPAGAPRELGRLIVDRLTAGPEPGRSWFEVDERGVRCTLDTPDVLGPSIDAMVNELVDYRLHRVLLQLSAERSGRVHQFEQGGRPIDARFTIDETGGRPTAVVIQSAGGAKGSGQERNLEYVAGVDLLLQRLRTLGIDVQDALVDTVRTTDLSAADRRLTTGGPAFPVDLTTLPDLAQFRAALLRSMKKVGQRPGATGGNNRRRLRIVIAAGDRWSAEELAGALATGKGTDTTRPSRAARRPDAG